MRRTGTVKSSRTSRPPGSATLAIMHGSSFSGDGKQMVGLIRAAIALNTAKRAKKAAKKTTKKK